MTQGKKEWLIADEAGQTLLGENSIIDVSLKSEGKVVAEPIEEGSFATYNKTSAPLEFQVTLAFAGANEEIMAALDKVEELKQSVRTFSLVTRYKEFANLTLERYDTKMTRESGLGVLYIFATLVEVQETEVQYSTYESSDASAVNTGKTTTNAPGAEQQEEAEKARKQTVAKKIFG